LPRRRLTLAACALQVYKDVMTESIPYASAPLNVCVLSLDATVGAGLMTGVCGNASGGVTELEGISVRLDLHTFDPAREQELGAVLSLADAAALVLQHMDAPALELLKAAYRILPSEHKLPVALLVVRDAGRLEFKMACPTCSQKLWVRDEDKGRVGRCPHCKKTFVLPAQSALLKQLLMLPESMPVVTVMVGHEASCRGPLANLAERARLRAQVLKSSTVPVQIAHDHKPPAE